MNPDFRTSDAPGPDSSLALPVATERQFAMVGVMRSALQHQPTGRTLRYFGSWLLGRLGFERLLHRARQLSLRDFHGRAHLVTDGTDAMFQLLGDTDEALISEFEEVRNEIRARGDLNDDWADAGAQTQLVLYAAVRSLRPTVVLETGVWTGASTAVILAALDRNGHGHLHSIDVRSDVGAVARAGCTDRWKLHVHTQVGSELEFRQVVRDLGPIDVFFHDSDHSWLWQTFELEEAAPHVTQLIVCDDADSSFAFLDHCKSRQVVPIAVVERTKVAGAYRVG